MGFYLNKVNTTPLIATSMMMMMMRLLAFCFLFSIGSRTQALASGPDTNGCQYEDEERHLTCEVQADSSRIPYLEAYSRATTLTVIGIFDEVDIAVQYAETITRLVLEPEWLENEVCSSDSFKLADYALFSSSLRALEVAGCYGAVSFEGAPAFVALEEMDFGEYAEVATDGYASFPVLRRLKLEGLTDFDLSVIPESLQKLDLSSNEITKIDFNKLGVGSQLEIDWSYNDIENLDLTTLEQCSRVMSLNLEFNSIDEKSLKGSFKNFTNLAILSLRENDFSKFDFSTLPESLRVFDVSYNNFKKFDLSSLPVTLTELDVSYNKIEKLNFTQLEHLVRLRTLDLTLNDIEENFSFEGVNKLSSLETLLMGGNGVKEVDFSYLPKSLRVLGTSYNLINKTDFSQLQHLVGLQTLDFSRNKLETLANFSFLPESLLHLDLSRNRIENVDFSQMQHLVRLQTLNLAQNKLETFSFDGIGKLSSLENLLLRGNRISAFDADATDLASLKNLKTLDLSKNHLKRFNFAILPTSFSKLNLYYNSLGKLDLEPLVTRDWSEVVLGNRNLQGGFDCSCKVLSDTYKIVSASGASKRELRFHCDEISDVRFEPATVSSYVHNREFPGQCDHYFTAATTTTTTAAATTTATTATTNKQTNKQTTNKQTTNKQTNKQT